MSRLIPVLLGGIVVLWGVAEPCSAQDEIEALVERPREWTVKTPEGEKKLAARLVDLKKGYVLFETDDGKQQSYPLDHLAAADRKTALIERIGSGVVVVRAKDVFDEEAGLGSGFLMHSSGLILTNLHVVAAAGSLEISFRDEKEPRSGEVLGIDRKHDVALVRVDKVPPGTHVLELSSKYLPQAGAVVWTAGHPQGLKNTVSWGDVNAVRKSTELPEELQKVFAAPADSRWIQTDAVLAQGSSGGPLLNEAGQAIGINTAVAGERIGFAIHISHARDAYIQAQKGEPLALPLPPSEHQGAMAWSSREIAPLAKAYSEELQKFSAVARQLPRAEAISRHTALQKKYRDDFVKLAEKDPASWPGFQALFYTLNLCGSDPESAACLKKACDLLLQHHGKEKDLAIVVAQLGSRSEDSVREFCERVVEVSPHEAVRFAASVSLAMSLIQWLDSPDTLDLEEIRQARQTAETLVTRVEKDFKDTEMARMGLTGEKVATAMRQQLSGNPLGLPAREIEGVDIEGKTFKLSEYKGKVVLLDFFANWCPYCRQMYPSERKMVEQHKDRPFALLGVHCESQKVLDELIAKGTVTWRTWADGQQGPIATQWNITGYPSVYLIDSSGIVRRRFSGVPQEEELTKAVEELLAEVDKKE